MATKAEFLVNKVEVLVALVTVSVAISSPVSRKAYLMNKPSCEETLGREDQHCSFKYKIRKRHLVFQFLAVVFSNEFLFYEIRIQKP